MISEFAQNLIDKIKTVPALENRVGLASAGGATDPSMASVPLPAAWLMFEGNSVTADVYQAPVEDMEFRFTLAVMVSYVDQPDLINTQYPTLDAIARSVSGKDSTSFGTRWRYLGAQLVDVFNDRLVYELSFMVAASFTN